MSCRSCRTDKCKCGGKQGPPGQQGPRGFIGQQGPVGLAGLQGAQGIQGVPGPNNPGLIVWSSGPLSLPLIGSAQTFALGYGSTGYVPSSLVSNILYSQFAFPAASATMRQLRVRADAFLDNIDNPQEFRFEIYRSVTDSVIILNNYLPTGLTATVTFQSGDNGGVSRYAEDLTTILPLVAGDMYVMVVTTASISDIVFPSLSLSASAIIDAPL